jgi:NADPH:quinone reductase-like Zn-dependent oxidoreductase
VLLVTGSRALHDLNLVAQTLDAVVRDLQLADDEFILLTGGAAGVDRNAMQWAHGRGIAVRTQRPAPRAGETFGRACVRRDAAMVAVARWVVAIWNGTSPGTRHTLRMAERAGTLMRVVIVPK